MEKSRYVQQVLDTFKQSFPATWIEDLNWDDKNNRTQKYKVGLSKIISFRLATFQYFSELVLAGDQLVSDTSMLDELLSETEIEIVPQGRDFKSKLAQEYINLLIDTRDSISLVKYHINITRERFSNQKQEALINAIPYNQQRINRNVFVSLLDSICDVCWFEYIFSYNEEYIKDLLMHKEMLVSERKSQSGKIVEIIDAAILKLDILLEKLSVFSKNKKISYNYDFHENIITINQQNKEDVPDFRNYFLKFMDVELLEEKDIIQWQKHTHEKDVNMWVLVFLMRYYVKKTKNPTQIDNLIRLFEKHYKQNDAQNENMVNTRACRSARNYMYNSRFSFRCQCDKDYSYKLLKKDLQEIEAIQDETFIFNYHPYQKAIEFIIKYITTKLADEKNTENLNESLEFLKSCYEKFKIRVDWCRQNQPYLMQLRFNFATIKKGDIAIFCPSTFCRPLKFSLLKEDLVQYNTSIAFLEYQVNHQSEKQKLLEASNKIVNMDRRNIEIMTVFVTITTFLVGLLSIFIGNTKDISIFSKIEYVVALGIILLSFVCLQYFAINKYMEKIKPYIFGILFIIFSIFIFVLYKQQIQSQQESIPGNATQTEQTIIQEKMKPVIEQKD